MSTSSEVRFVAGDWDVTIIHLTGTGKPGGDGYFYRIRHCGAFVANVRTPDEVRAELGPTTFALLRQPADDLAEATRLLAGDRLPGEDGPR
jgi:hypothetical protein